MRERSLEPRWAGSRQARRAWSRRGSLRPGLGGAVLLETAARRLTRDEASPVYYNVLPQSALGVWLTDQTRIYSQFPQRTARTAKDLLFGETVLGETPPPRKVSVRDGGSLLPGCLTGAGVWGGGDSSRAVSLASRIRGRRRPRKNQFFSCVSFCLSGMMDLLISIFLI